MSDRLHFLPYLRVGLASNIVRSAVDGLIDQPTVTARVSASVEGFRVGDDTDPDVRSLAARDIRLYGPGSITGLDTSTIVRRYPEPGARDPETNYFALVEIDAADLPWRYTPAAPDAAGRLQPWLTLIVVEDRVGRFETGSGTLDQITVDESELPPLADVWAWAHVQIDDARTQLSDDDVLELWAAKPRAFRARLMAPVRLRPDMQWRACVVPTTEAGRLAGLGQPGLDAAGGAWTGGSTATGEVTLPVYDSWRFQTAQAGDFESLIRRLTPRELPPTVGVRDLDVSDPGSGIPVDGGDRLLFKGALVSPAAGSVAWTNPQKSSIQDGLRELLEPSPEAPDADDDEAYDALTHDPVVRPSLYGSMQSGHDRLHPDNSPDHVRWMDDLNLDPRARTVGGVGSAVVRDDQERLMDAAWRAADGLANVNRLLNAATLADQAGTALGDRLRGLDDESLTQFVGPALARQRGDRGTLLADLAATDLPDVVGRGAFRRLTRTNGPVARRLDVERPGNRVITRLRTDPNGPIGSFRRAAVPAGCSTGMPLDGEEPPTDTPIHQIDPEIAKWIDPKNRGELAPLMLDDARPWKSPQVGVPGRLVVKNRDGFERVSVEPSRPLRVRKPLPDPAGSDTARFIGAVGRALDVTAPIGQRLRSRIGAPDDMWDDAVPSRMWATPNFPRPVYERIRDLSIEYLVPGVGDIPDETVGLLETNDRYVESAMVGANQELSREFLWREYPAELHRTWFRQFWNAPVPDIGPIDGWFADRPLGSQDGSASADLVLVLKGVFPRRYPDVIVTAQRGAWVLNDDNDSWRRDLQPGGDVLRPILAGELQPGVVFYGFALTEEAARGDEIESWGDGDPGWFFVLEERPKGTRFGLDRFSRDEHTNEILGLGEAPATWDDISWANVAPDGSTDGPAYVDLVESADWIGKDPIPGLSGDDSWASDATQMARITLQRPIRMKVHASAMLPGAGD